MLVLELYDVCLEIIIYFLPICLFLSAETDEELDKIRKTLVTVSHFTKGDFIAHRLYCCYTITKPA